MENEQTKEPKRISYSQFSMFLECPYKWYLSYIKNLRSREGSIHTVFGTGIHHVLQEYLKVMYEESAVKADNLDLIQIFKEKYFQLFREFRDEFHKDLCSKEEFKSFFEDGIEIINYFKRNRKDYFPNKGFHLLGIEIPLDFSITDNIKWIGYIDIAIEDTINKRIKIIDFKTSTRGWTEYQKKSPTKISQLILYKKFYSKIFNYDIDKIDVEFLILKRKLYENVDYPQKRMQRFKPASGTPTINKTLTSLKSFIDTGFTPEGEYNENFEFAKAESSSSCKYCEFAKLKMCENNK
jgi:hypothetical protein